MADESVHMVCTSPPYWGLRDYGTATWVGGDSSCDHKQGRPGAGRADGIGVGSMGGDCQKCGAKRIDSQLGLEPDINQYVANMVEVFRAVKRVLRHDGTLWLNLGDSFATSPAGNKPNTTALSSGLPNSIANQEMRRAAQCTKKGYGDLKQKDLCMIPARVALALQADGWYLRQDLIWCLSGGVWIYARTQKGDMPMMVRDLARLRPGTVQLWNGIKWTTLLGMSRSKRQGDEVEIVLRSGERLSCTLTHQFPTDRGLLSAAQLQQGDVIETVKLPQPDNPRDCAIDEDAAWFAGLYLAEGSRSGDLIQISGHIKEDARWDRVQLVAAKFGGSATRTIEGNKCNIRVSGKILNAIIAELVSGHVAKDKGFASVVWRYSDAFIASMLNGYLSGDGHWDTKNKRWRLGFTRNYNLERDFRVSCARLGYHLSLRPSTARYQGGIVPSFRGELRMERSGHFNQCKMGEVVEIRKARCREVYDLGVADTPHVFALASGILTHNSKPNPMPESVTDRCTKSHEYIFMLTKSERYYFDNEAIKEDAVAAERGSGNIERKPAGLRDVPGASKTDPNGGVAGSIPWEGSTRNKRSVWHIATAPFPGAHFATMPPALVEPCIKAGTSARGCCPQCGAPWERVVQKQYRHHARWFGDKQDARHSRGSAGVSYDEPIGSKTQGWRPACSCRDESDWPEYDPKPKKDAPKEQWEAWERVKDYVDAERERLLTLWKKWPTVPCTTLDPFSGAGTTALVSKRLGRDSIAIELNPAYTDMAKKRVYGEMPLFMGISG